MKITQLRLKDFGLDVFNYKQKELRGENNETKNIEDI